MSPREGTVVYSRNASRPYDVEIHVLGCDCDHCDPVEPVSVAQQVASEGRRGAPDPHLIAGILRDLQHRFMKDVPPGAALFDHAVGGREHLRSDG